jgi:hypothetical protein
MNTNPLQTLQFIIVVFFSKVYWMYVFPITLLWNTFLNFICAAHIRKPSSIFYIQYELPSEITHAHRGYNFLYHIIFAWIATLRTLYAVAAYANTYITLGAELRALSVLQDKPLIYSPPDSVRSVGKCRTWFEWSFKANAIETLRINT